jgi:leucyl-tRNA synthetase
MLGEKKSINLSSWPKYNESLFQDEEIKIVVQINGKVRAEIMITADDAEEAIKKQALSNQAILKHIEGKEIKKVIYVKNRLINIVL